MAPRKFRNAEERAEARAEALPRLAELEHALLGAGGAAEEQQGMQTLRAALDKFVAQADRGGALTGAVPLPTLGLRLEYALPGRRVERVFVRAVKI